MSMDNDQLRIREYEQALELIEAIKQDVLNGEILSVLIVCERSDGQMQGGTTATSNQYALCGYMFKWALNRMGFTTFSDVRNMIMGDRT
jgi:hypothetical protein